MRALFEMGCVMTVSLVALCSGCGSSDDESSLDARSEAIIRLCRKAGECSGVTLSLSDTRECREQLGALAMVLVNPTEFSDCISELSCTEMEDETAVQSCLNLDPTTIECSDDALTACTNSGECGRIDCVTACGFVDGQFVNCGRSSDYGYDVCMCSV